MKNFWNILPKPFFVLAPMADVTDIAFREIITKYGKPNVLWTEFVSADGLVSEKGREHLLIDLAYTESERPIVAQLFTSKPENMRKVAEIVRELGFDGLDINMGCPDRTIEKQGAGAALMKNPKLAQEIIYSAKEGAGDMPVSVKTRLGYNKDVMEEWLPMILETKPAAITVHARTRKEMSKVPARWERVADAVKIRNEMKSGSLIIGNGDVVDLADAENKVKESGADGAMFGRAIFGNPWLFNRNSLFQCSQEHWNKECVFSKSDSGNIHPFGDNQRQVCVCQRLKVLVEHTKLFDKLLGRKKNFAIMKKHYKAYCEGFRGAKELRVKLMEAGNAGEVDAIVKDFLSQV